MQVKIKTNCLEYKNNIQGSATTNHGSSGSSLLNIAVHLNTSQYRPIQATVSLTINTHSKNFNRLTSNTIHHITKRRCKMISSHTAQKTNTFHHNSLTIDSEAVVIDVDEIKVEAAFQFLESERVPY